MCAQIVFAQLMFAVVCEAYTQRGTTALIVAAQEGRTDCVRLLLDAGADKNALSEVLVGRFIIAFGVLCCV